MLSRSNEMNLMGEKISQDDRRTFWKRIRHFYRSGEITKDYSAKNLRSAFFSGRSEELDIAPFVADDDEIRFGPHAPFELLSKALNEHQKKNKQTFNQKLKSLIAGLSQLLNIKEESEDSIYDFAQEIVAFEKLTELLPQNKSDVLSDRRLDRLKKALDKLKKGVEYFDESVGILVVSRSDTFNVNLVKEAEIVVADHGYLLAAAEKGMQNQVGFFTELVKHMRIAELEVDSSYDEEIHDEYFDHFSWYQIGEEEKNLFLPFMIIVDHQYLMNHLDEFSRLLSSNKPYRFIVLNQEAVSKAHGSLSWEDASHSYRRELNSFAISHRNVISFQSALDDLGFVFGGIRTCLQSYMPAVLHLLVPGSASTLDMLNLSLASSGRYFPKISYDPSKSRAERKLAIDSNEQSEKNWPDYSISFDESSSDFTLPFTYGDYKALFHLKAEELMLIPDDLAEDENFIPLHEYLESEADKLYGKIPFIWLENEEHKLFRAAVPNVWVVSCQERLDFWNFLQEMGSTNPTDEHPYNPSDIEEMKKKHEEEKIKIREEALRESAGVLMNVLLSDGGK